MCRIKRIKPNWPPCVSEETAHAANGMRKVDRYGTTVVKYDICTRMRGKIEVIEGYSRCENCGIRKDQARDQATHRGAVSETFKIG